MTRAQAVWLMLTQAVVLGLTALALHYADAPPTPQRHLLALLALALLVVTLVPRWRRGQIAGILGGVTCALACWLSAAHTFTLDDPGDLGLIAGYVPVMAPIAAGAALALTVWGAFARGGLRDDARFGVAALAGSTLVAVSGIALYLLINTVPMFSALYAIDAYQLAALLAAAVLYGSTIWLGSIGIRATARGHFLPLGLVVIIAAFLVHWLKA